MSRVYSKGAPGKYGLCIDWETSGSNFTGLSHEEYQGISYGAIIFDTETFEPVEELYREIQFDETKYKWSDAAEAIHGLSRDYLAKNGVSREEALTDLLDMIVRYIGTDKIFMLGHNSIFDRDFTLQLASDFGVSLKFHHVILDTSSTSFILNGMNKSNDVFSFWCGITRTENHNALEDARLALGAARAMRLLCKAALEG